MIFDDVKAAIYTWASEIEDSVPVVWADQNAPAPETPYTVLRIQSIVHVNHDSVTVPYEFPPIDDEHPETHKQFYEGVREFTLSIQTFGADAMQRLSTLRDSLERESIQSSLAANGVIFVDRLSFSNITGLDGSRFEERGSCELLFRNESVTEDTVDIIEKVEITTEYLQADEIIHSDLITITI